ncbi:MAG: SPOR domain-containing protein [Bacteroidota bacterium]
MMRLIIALVLSIGTMGAAAQTAQPTSVQSQSVTLNEDYMVGRLMQKYVELNRFEDKVEGWRIQVLATTDRQKMESAKANFQSKYPAIPVDWVHAPPYYKLRVGAFATRLDAIRTLQRVKRDFPSAYPAKDNGLRPLDIINANY